MEETNTESIVQNEPSAGGQTTGNGGVGTPPAQEPPATNRNDAVATMPKAEFDGAVAETVAKTLQEMGITAAKPTESPKEGGDKNASTEKLEHYVEAVKAGVPYEKAERYARIAETYMDKDTDFAKALTKAVADFPYADPPASAGTAGQDGSASAAELPDAGKIKDIFAKG